MRIYPLTSLRDWREEARRSQERANELRERAANRIDWIDAGIFALAIIVLLLLLKVLIPVAT